MFCRGVVSSAQACHLQIFTLLTVRNPSTPQNRLPATDEEDTPQYSDDEKHNVDELHTKTQYQMSFHLQKFVGAQSPFYKFCSNSHQKTFFSFQESLVKIN